MEKLQVFKTKNFGDIRTITIDNNMWIAKVDALKVLGLNQSTSMAALGVDNADIGEHELLQTRTYAPLKTLNLNAINYIAKKRNNSQALAGLDFLRWLASGAEDNSNEISTSESLIEGVFSIEKPNKTQVEIIKLLDYLNSNQIEKLHAFITGALLLKN